MSREDWRDSANVTTTQGHWRRVYLILVVKPYPNTSWQAPQRRYIVHHTSVSLAAMATHTCHDFVISEVQRIPIFHWQCRHQTYWDITCTMWRLQAPSRAVTCCNLCWGAEWRGWTVIDGWGCDPMFAWIHICMHSATKQTIPKTWLRQDWVLGR